MLGSKILECLVLMITDAIEVKI